MLVIVYMGQNKISKLLILPSVFIGDIFGLTFVGYLLRNYFGRVSIFIGLLLGISLGFYHMYFLVKKYEQ